jgi:hypothetical protein
MFVFSRNQTLIPATNVKNIFSRVLGNFVHLSGEIIGNGWPVRIVLGGVGLASVLLGVGQEATGQIHQNEFEVRRDLQDGDSNNQSAIIEAFLDQLFDLAGERR